VASVPRRDFARPEVGGVEAFAEPFVDAGLTNAARPATGDDDADLH
jgi:hypothetical protein